MRRQGQKPVFPHRMGRQVVSVILFVLSAVLQAQPDEAELHRQERIRQIEERIRVLEEQLRSIDPQASTRQSGDESNTVQAAEEGQVDLFELPLEQLMEIAIPTAASLTRTTQRLTPSTVTTITQEQIRRSGARSLYELLEMYVPNLQVIFARERTRAVGLRGIIAHQNDKFLLLVNGRIMNERTDSGAITELDLPMLTDIHHIDIVRGPSSALYGPGALSMTINIITHTYQTFEGQEATLRAGFVENYATGEFKHSRKLSEDSGLFLYAGASKYDGADIADSPMVFGTQEPMWLLEDISTSTWKIYQGDEQVKDWFKNLNQMPFERPKMKLFAQYTRGGFDLWARYTQGGEWIDFTAWHDFPRDDWWHVRMFAKEGIVYSQATIQASYDQEIASDLSLRYVLSYDRFTNENENFEQATFRKRYAEDEIYGRILARWNPARNHSLAFGTEWSHERFGLSLSGPAVSNQPFMFHYPPNRTDPSASNWVGYMPQWSTDTYALFGEYQWNINDLMTVFVSSRLDWHPYTETMFSPRGVLVVTPSEQDTLKLMASRSVRTNSAAQMWIDYNYLDITSPVDKLYAYELRYERQHSDNLWLAGSVFLYEMPGILGDTSEVAEGTSSGTKVVGDMKLWGFELEAGWKGKRLKVDLSHSFTKLIDMKGEPGILWHNYSAAPFGVGNDLAQWHNHTSKVRAEYQYNDRWLLYGSLCVLWGSPGGQDAADYRDQMFPNWDYMSGFKEPFKASAYLNLGAEYKWSPNTTLTFTGYNLLGLVDEDLNKRRVGFDRQLPGRYRILPVSFGVMLTHRF